MDSVRLLKTLKRASIKKTAAREPEEVLIATERIRALCGEEGMRHQMLCRIAEILLLKQRPTIIAPVCPDYETRDGRYVFNRLGNGVPLLARRHIELLDRVLAIAPFCHVHMLIADHEADDTALCASVGVSREIFLQRVLESLEAIRAEVTSRGWSAEYMTTAIPNLVAEEEYYAVRIANDPSFNQQITSDTIARSEMYNRISLRFSEAERRARTIQTAAQYVAMGMYAAEHGHLVCNHTTTNLVWYRKTGAALLHNPIAVY